MRAALRTPSTQRGSCAKCADANGDPCGRQTVGLLTRRHMTAAKLHFIGKESNKLEEAEEHMVSDLGDVYTEYPDPQRDDWKTKILPALRAMPMQNLIERSRLSRRALQMIRAGRRPSAKNVSILSAVANSEEMRQSKERTRER